MPIYRGKYNQQIYYGDKKVLAVFAGEQQVYSSEPLNASLIDRSLSGTFYVPHGTTRIGMDAFRECTKVGYIVIPNTVDSIETKPFWNCSNLRSIYIPSSVKYIDMSALDTGYHRNLTNIYCGFAEGAVSGAPWGASTDVTIHYNMPPPEDPPAESCCIKSATALFIERSIRTAIIPDSVTYLNNSFLRCFGLTSVVIPDSVHSMYGSSFGYTSLKSIYIPSSVKYMEFAFPATFDNCRSLTDIYCGFAEGAVSGAPWGATNATIHYNSNGPE